MGEEGKILGALGATAILVAGILMVANASSMPELGTGLVVIVLGAVFALNLLDE